MDQIFGTQFRKQTQDRPLWHRILMWLMAGMFMLWSAFWIMRSGEFAWTQWRLLPAHRQDTAGRIFALGSGLLTLATYVMRWRAAFYLDPPMRDLVTTPASHWQIFKLALRARWTWVGAGFLALFLYPFFPAEWMKALAISAWYQRVPLSIISAIGWACFGQIFLHLLAIAFSLLIATIGFGGAAPRYAIPDVLKPLYTALCFGIAAGLLMAMTVLAIDKPSELLQKSTWWQAGEVIVGAVDNPNGIAHTLLMWFPSVVGFDAMRSSVAGPASLFYSAGLGCAVWFVAGIGVIALCCRPGLGMAARATWHLDSAAPKPADALPEKKRRHDPDKVNGPIEAWLVGRFGRMGRSVLRLISAIFDVGAVDRHLVYSIALMPLCLVSAYALMWIVPDTIESILVMFQMHLDNEGRANITNVCAAACILITLLYRMTIWGALSMNVKQTGRSPAFFNTSGTSAVSGNISFLLVRDSSIPATRGDNRYPLTEIYPVGFSDAVLLPTFYALIFLLLLGSMSLVEGLLTGLNPDVLIWCVAIGVPGLAQIGYLAAIGTSIVNWADYRRSWIATFVRSVSIGLLIATILISIMLLIIYLCHQCINAGRPWTGWLGSLNILLIVDVAIYMSARWFYIQRKFDAEKKYVRTFQ